MVDFVNAFATAAQAIKLVQDLRGIEKAFDAAELKLKIADLTVALADLKVVLSEAKQEIADLQENKSRLETLLSKVGEMVEVGHFKYLKDAEGKPKGYPICPVCVQKHGMYFHTTDNYSVPGHPQQCPNCKALYHNVQVFED